MLYIIVNMISVPRKTSGIKAENGFSMLFVRIFALLFLHFQSQFVCWIRIRLNYYLYEIECSSETADVQE